MTKQQLELTVGETSGAIDRRMQRVYQLLYEGTLTARKDARGRWLISREAIDAYLKKRELRAAAWKRN